MNPLEALLKSAVFLYVLGTIIMGIPLGLYFLGKYLGIDLLGIFVALGILYCFYVTYKVIKGDW